MTADESNSPSARQKHQENIAEKSRKKAKWCARLPWLLLLLISLLLLGLALWLLVFHETELDSQLRATAENGQATLSPACGNALKDAGRVWSQSNCVYPYRSSSQLSGEVLALLWLPLAATALAHLILPQPADRNATRAEYIKIGRHRALWRISVFVALSFVVLIPLAFTNYGFQNVRVLSVRILAEPGIIPTGGRWRDFFYAQTLAAVVTLIGSAVIGLFQGWAWRSQPASTD